MKRALVIFLAALGVAVAAPAALRPVDLRCEYAVNPLGVDVPQPRLFWKLQSRERGQVQSAYEILVSSSPELLARNEGDLWDSGKVDSDEPIQILYAGRALSSFQQVFWKVRVWDAHGKVSAWSRPAKWTMGVLKESDWHAGWISTPETNWSSTLLRREFVVKSGLTRAVLNVCGLGQYELTLNGRKVGDDFLSPGWTDYRKTCLYDTFDVTKQLQPGTNAIGLELGNGMYRVVREPGRFSKFAGSFGPQQAIAQLRLEYADGSVEFLGTDDRWRTAPGPITFSSIYGGEDFDGRLDPHGWNRPGFDDSKWQPVRLISGPGGRLRGLSCAAPPLKFFETHKPVAHWALTNGDVVFDLGQNAAHVLRITVRGPAGSTVRLLPAELTNADGSVTQDSMGAGRRGAIWCGFTKATDGTETWSPKFFYVGCRYVHAHWVPAQPGGRLPELKKLEGVVVHSASDPVGRFECSDELMNRIFRLVRWAQQNNMMSLMTDCPHRERLGWLEEDHLNGPALRYDFDLARLFTKQMNDLADAQLTNGLVPDIAPEYTVFKGGFRDSPEWGSACILVPWQQYEFDGDVPLLERHYDTMKRYLACLASTADSNNIVRHGLGDWYDLGPKPPGIAQLTPVALTATAFYYEDAWTLARIASVLGKSGEAEQFSALAEKIRRSFNQEFFDVTNRCYATGSQCANAISLAMGLCEPAQRPAVLEALVRDIRARDNALTAGDVGYRWVLRALADGGRSDVIWQMNRQADKPGYAYQLERGATSLTESWNARRGSSQDHFMLGQIQEWFYHDLAGLQNAPGSAAFKHIVIAPQPVGDLKWVRARYDSLRGRMISAWKRTGKTFRLQVAIPPGTSATVYVPASSPDRVTENGRPASQSKGVFFLRMEGGCAVFEIESGSYNFESWDVADKQ
ncbi:MAG TPA: family 78 glycoside hydrolase catalytic domain [Verrucomicrobiae bacterium]|nr:family 78 glycoside hydrolase catalytic domain [Verrucomicrobiae bacterium]